MTVSECPDSLTALLTQSDSLPGCDHKRCMGVTVCARAHPVSQTGAWTDGRISQTVADGGVWVTTLFSSLCFLKGGDDEAEAQTQASLSALKECGGTRWRKDT